MGLVKSRLKSDQVVLHILTVFCRVKRFKKSGMAKDTTEVASVKFSWALRWRCRLKMEYAAAGGVVASTLGAICEGVDTILSNCRSGVAMVLETKRDLMEFCIWSLACEDMRMSLAATTA